MNDGGTNVKKKYHTPSLWRRVLARIMVLALVASLFPVGMAQSVSAVELPEDEIKEMWEIALENGYTHYDTIDLCGGNSHLQGICVDDKWSICISPIPVLLLRLI